MGTRGRARATARVAARAAAAIVAAIASAFSLGACFTDEPPELTTSPVTGAPTSTSTGEASTTAGTTEMSTTADTTTEGTTTEGTTGETTTVGTTAGADPVYSCPNVPELVLCYEFETGWSDSSLLDTSDSLHHGFMVDVTQALGHSGSAALLDGSSAVFVSYDEKIFGRLLAAFTVAAWIKPSAEGLTGIRGIVERDGNIRLALVANAEAYEVSCDSPLAGTVLSALALEPDVWVHAACVYDGETLGLWVDGALAGEVAGTIGVLGDDSLRIGNDGPDVGPGSALLGLIDEVQVWELALKGQALCGAAGIVGCT